MHARIAIRRMVRSTWIVAVAQVGMCLAFQQQPAPRRPATGRPDDRPGVETNRGMGNVNAEALKDLKSLSLEGPEKQLESILKIIEEIDLLSGGAKADIKVVPLKNADSESLAKLLTGIYTARAAAQPGATQAQGGANAAAGKVGFVAIAQPNSVVVIAQKTEIDEVVAFVEELDQENKNALPQFHLFQLKEAPASEVQQRLQQFFALSQDTAAGGGGGTARVPAGLRARVEIIADPRTNSLFVFAGPQDLATAAKMIEKLDTLQPGSFNELRVFPLKNSIASDLANLLQAAILTRAQAVNAASAGTQAAGQAGQQQGGPLGLQGNQQQQQGGAFGARQATQTSQAISSGSLKSSRLRFVTPDKKTGRFVESGILEDITIGADDRTNSLMVTAPTSSMNLMAELIRQFDALPSPTAQLKVFKLANADAQAMLTTLQQVFLGQQGGAAGGQFGGVGQALQNRQQNVSFAIGGADPAVSLVQLSFSLDARTNSIIVAGSANDILAVEALLIKLDSNTDRERKTIVYRLKNLGAQDASTAIDTFLQQQASAGNIGQALGGAAGQNLALTLQQQIRTEVSVVPEPTTNILIISSTPRYFDEVVRIIDEIDTRPPQVLIQVLIADVQLTDDEELGLEMGIQSDVLFDRSLAVTNANSSTTLVPGFNFNTTQPLGSAVSPGADVVGMQGLSNFSLGRGSTRNGFGGLIFSASSENISVLLRALKRQQRVDILSRPQVMALDNQAAFIQIGQSVPVIQNSQVAQNGTTINGVEYRDVGIILQVTPRINDDGTVVMNVQPQVSSINPVGQPISTNLDGTVVATAPIIDITQAQTTVTAQNGQTIVIGGLIRRERNYDKRKIPFWGDLPVVGWLGKTEFKFGTKRELLIILTPQIIYGQCDMQRIKDAEARRIGWNLGDVEKIHGDPGLTEYGKEYIGPGAMFKARPTRSAAKPGQQNLRHYEEKEKREQAANQSGAMFGDGGSAVETAIPQGAPASPADPAMPVPSIPGPGNAPRNGPGTMPIPPPIIKTGHTGSIVPTSNSFASDITVLTSGDRPNAKTGGKPPAPIYVNAPLVKEKDPAQSKPKKTTGLFRMFGSKPNQEEDE